MSRSTMPTHPPTIRIRRAVAAPIPLAPPVTMTESCGCPPAVGDIASAVVIGALREFDQFRDVALRRQDVDDLRPAAPQRLRWEERRVGKECVSTFSSRWSQDT